MAKSNSTQQVIDIAGIKDGIVVMRDGSYRLVLQVSATNFALKSEQEQNSIIFQYQSFLNALHFPIQIVLNSRKLDLTPYIAKIERLGEAQTSDLLKVQTADYIDFLKKLIDIANIMKKTFYVVIPYEPISIKKMTFVDNLFGRKSAFGQLKISDLDYKADTNKLKERATTVANGLGSMGLHCFQLSTEALIELYYLMYNPDEAVKERVRDADDLSSPVIMSKGESPEAVAQAGKSPSEEVIDNTAVVQAQQEAESRTKRQEDLKEAERDVRTTPPQTPPAQNQPFTPSAQSSASVQPAQNTPAPTQSQSPTTSTTSPTPQQPASPTTNQQGVPPNNYPQT